MYSYDRDIIVTPRSAGRFYLLITLDILIIRVCLSYYSPVESVLHHLDFCYPSFRHGFVWDMLVWVLLSGVSCLYLTFGVNGPDFVRFIRTRNLPLTEKVSSPLSSLDHDCHTSFTGRGYSSDTTNCIIIAFAGCTAYPRQA